MVRRTLVGVAVLALLVIAAGLTLAWHSAMPEIDPPAADSFASADVERGRMLAGIGDCAVCHTAPGGEPYAGGLALPTGFGTLYTPNITPDPDHGIGHWSEAAFARAMRKGIDDEGEYLFPAFPYDHFSQVTDDDVKALYAFIMTRPTSTNDAPDNTLRFPFNVRLLQAGWQLLFFDEGPYRKVAGKSDEWNRGAYLSEGLGHCSACHTPRNKAGAEEPDRAYAGALVDGWYAPALDRHPTAPVAWSADELYAYLRKGMSDLHGVAVGSMAPIVHQGLSEASDADLHAIATYFADKGDTGAMNEPGAHARDLIASAHAREDVQKGRGEHIWNVACASCHYNDPERPQALRPEMSLNSAVSAPDPVNLIRVTLDGVSVDDGVPGVMMPAFASLSDEDLTALVTWLRSTQSERAPWPDVAERVRSLRK